MSLSKKMRDEITQFILWNISDHPKDVVHFTQEKYKLSRTTVLKYLSELEHEHKIEIREQPRDRKYTLVPLVSFRQTYQIQDKLAEDKVWRTGIAPLFSNVNKRIFNICHYGFTEIFNNAIDHFEGKTIIVLVSIWIDKILMWITDDGVGRFNKIQKKYDLDDPLHAILELSKGKLTTDPDSHTGEGIFFTSRMFDTFIVFSGRYYLQLQKKSISCLNPIKMWREPKYLWIFHKSRTELPLACFRNLLASSDNYGFTKTVVPVKLARYGNENLVSRSQAKRLLTRLEKFKTVILDFQNIELIGRAFADEIFRDIVRNHPNTALLAINDNKSIKTIS